MAKKSQIRVTTADQVADSDDFTFLEAFHRVFWPAYPRKKGKPAAYAAWKRLKLADDDQAGLDAIMDGLERDKARWDLTRLMFIPYPATWLNQRRWEDETE